MRTACGPLTLVAMNELLHDPAFLHRVERDLADAAVDLRRAADPTPPDPGPALRSETAAALRLLAGRAELLGAAMADTAEAVTVTRTYAVLSDDAAASGFGSRTGGRP
jgi:hypothetical protein